MVHRRLWRDTHFPYGTCTIHAIRHVAAVAGSIPAEPEGQQGMFGLPVVGVIIGSNQRAIELLSQQVVNPLNIVDGVANEVAYFGRRRRMMVQCVLSQSIAAGSDFVRLSWLVPIEA